MCGSIKHDLKLSDRIDHCDVCGLIMDRDLKAAINIHKLGLIQVGGALPNSRLWRLELYPKGQLRSKKQEAPGNAGGGCHHLKFHDIGIADK